MESIIIPVAIVVAIALISGVILTAASKVMAVKTDERMSNIREVLPGANCGACGYAGCDDYASALVGEGEVSVSQCPVGGSSVAETIAEILGREANPGEPKTAEVMCRGYGDAVRRITKLERVESCKASMYLYGGQMECQYGCIGGGDCVKSCPQEAIRLEDGLAVVNKALCVGCGLCAKICPKSIIEMIGKSTPIYVKCKSHDTGMNTMRACEMGCIACGKCVKSCNFDAIKIVDYLAVIDKEKCKNCGMCEKVCMTGAIINLKKKDAYF